MTKSLKIVLTSFFVTAALIKGAPTAANPPEPAVSVSFVRTADLDLSTAKGERVLEHRLAVAAREVCGAAADVDLEGRNDVRKCRADVLARAHEQRDALLAAANRGALIAISSAR